MSFGNIIFTLEYILCSYMPGDTTLTLTATLTGANRVYL